MQPQGRSFRKGRAAFSLRGCVQPPFSLSEVEGHAAPLARVPKGSACEGGHPSVRPSACHLSCRGGCLERRKRGRGDDGPPTRYGHQWRGSTDRSNPGPQVEREGRSHLDHLFRAGQRDRDIGIARRIGRLRPAGADRDNDGRGVGRVRHSQIDHDQHRIAGHNRLDLGIAGAAVPGLGSALITFTCTAWPTGTSAAGTCVPVWSGP